MYSVEVLFQDERTITVKLNDFPIQYANALRRICLSGVPVFAIDTVDVIENTTVFADEYLAHRLALVPLTTPTGKYNVPAQCDCQREEGCTNCSVMLLLKSGGTSETEDLTTARLSSEDPEVKPVNDDIPIATLAPMQKVEMECHARLGRGLDHAKWNASNISVLTGSEEEGLQLKVETAGSLNPASIILAGVEELERRLEEFGRAIQS